MAFFLFAVLAFFIWRYFDRRKKQRRIRLTNYQKRLKIVVAELFTQSNEMDTVSKYSGLDRDAKWTRSYQDALSKLLMANERLNDCPEFLNGGQLDTAQEYLLLIARASYQVHKQFIVIAPVENFDGLQDRGESQANQDKVTGAQQGSRAGERSGKEADTQHGKVRETHNEVSYGAAKSEKGAPAEEKRETSEADAELESDDEVETDAGYVIRLDQKQIHKKKNT